MLRPVRSALSARSIDSRHPTSPRRTRTARFTVMAAAALLLAACGDDRDGSTEGTEPGGQRLTVVTGFYALEYALERVAGDQVEIVSLTAPGIDPHDLELSPRDVGRIGSADLVLYATGMQDAVDQAVAQQAPDHALDAAQAAGLVALGDHHVDEDAHEDTDDDHDHGEEDPHFWLDPTRYADVVEAISEELAELDPDGAEEYRANAAEFVAELTDLDEAYRTGLSSCEYTDVITTHAAFGYLTDRYGLVQVPMTGISPESEPTPGRMAQITRLVQDRGVPTIYSEIIAGTQIADTIAAETGATVLALDPIEGLTDASPGDNYVEIMQANLEALRVGQVCS